MLVIFLLILNKFLILIVIYLLLEKFCFIEVYESFFLFLLVTSYLELPLDDKNSYYFSVFAFILHLYLSK